MGSRKFVFLGFRRGGSSITFMLLQHLLLNSGLRAKDIVANHHQQGIPTDQIPASVLEGAFTSNHLVGCFRNSVQILDEIAVSNLCPILMTRDPRDCEQSWYHARYLHTSGELAVMPIESASLPESLVHEETFDIDIRDLLAFTRKHDGLILRYEDMVLEPLAFLNKFIDFTGLPIKRSAVDCALVMANFVQAGRDEGAHNRSGAPYSAVHTLPREMLEKLNKRFGALIVDMGYPLWPDEAPVIDLVPLMERDATKRFTMALAEENGFRIDEIRELHDKLAGQAQELVELKHENGLRVDGIRQVKHGLEAARISIAALRQENGFRTDEIRQLASDGLEAKERQFLECVIANQADRIRMLEDDFSQMATASIASLIVARIKRRLGLRLAQEIQGGGGIWATQNRLISII